MPSCIAPYQCCLSSTQIFFDPNNRLAKFFQSAEGRDKALKLVDPILDAIGEIAKAANASEDTLNGIKAGRDFARAGRDAHAFFNIFNGVIGALALYLANFWKLIEGLCSGEDVVLKPEEAKRIKAGEIQIRDKTGKVMLEKSRVKDNSYHMPDAPYNSEAK